MNLHRHVFLLLITAASAIAPAAQAQVSGFGSFAAPNGTATTNGSTLTLTKNAGSDTGSLFTVTPQDISRGFDASFLYTVGGDQKADGFTFTLQNDPRGASALGSGGGYLGYGGVGGIDHSAAVEFNFNQSNSTGFDTNAAIGTPTDILGGVRLASGQPVGVHLVYDGATLSETLTQAGGSAFTVQYATGSLESVLGGPAAFAGFTGSDGGGASTQTISEFSFRNTPAAVPEASSSAALGLLLALSGALAVARKKKSV